MEMKTRLDKLVASQTALTRSEAGRAIRSGRVTVDGGIVTSPAAPCLPESQQVCLDGQPLFYRAHVYLMLNKPAGILCVSRDPHARTVVDLVPPSLRRRGLFPAGRLDKDTHGFVLLTDDGDFGHRLISPKHEIHKLYHARLAAPVGQAEIDAFAQGTCLKDGTVCRPAALTILEDGSHPLVSVDICEGKYHQVRRMAAAVGNHVEWLKRVRIGGVALDESLPEGACRELTSEECAAIFTQGPNL